MAYNLYDFIKQKEGFRENAYWDPHGQVWTVGYGATGGDIGQHTRQSQGQADSWIRNRVDNDRDYVKSWASRHGYDWNENQIDALTSGVYNMGRGYLDKVTKGGSRDDSTIAKKITQYNKAGGQTLPGLVTRRNEESALFMGKSQAPQRNRAPLQAHKKTHQPNQEKRGYAPLSKGQSFGQAFAAARQAQGSGGEFTWKGKRYNTRLQGEEEQKPVYANQGGYMKPIYMNDGGALDALFAPANIERHNMQFLQNAQDYELQESYMEDPSSPFAIKIAQELQRREQVRNAALNQEGSALDALFKNNGGYIAAKDGGWFNSIADWFSGPSEEEKRQRILAAQMAQNTGAATQDDRDRLNQWQPSANGPAGPGVDPRAAAMQAGAGYGPVPMSDEMLLRSSSEEQNKINSLPIGHPDRVAAIESGTFIPTEGDLLHEEQQWKTNEELQRAQLQAAVTAPDAPGAQFIQDRVNALTDQVDSLGVPQTDQGVGTDVYVGGPDQPVLRDQSGLGAAPNDVGAVPGLIDTQAPLPQEVIDSNPQDIWGGMDEIQAAPGEEDQAILQGAWTDSPVSAQGAPELGAVEAQHPNVPSLDPNLSPDLTDERGETRPNPKWNSSKKIDTANDVVTNIEGENGENTPDQSTIEAAGGETGIMETGQQQSVQNPGAANEAKGALKEAFGDLFDKKELARAAIMYLGARATGMSGGQALAFAGRGYIGRLDAKENNKVKVVNDLVKGGKYTTQSIKAYKDSGDPSVLIPTDPAEGGLERTGNFSTLYGPKGAVTVEEVKLANGSKILVDKNNNPISRFDYHEDASRVAGTPEYRSRIVTESKDLGGIVKGMQDQVLAEVKAGGGDGGLRTDILPEVAGRDAAKWAIENNVPPTEMGQLLQNAYHSAQSAGKDGKRAKSILPFLNEQWATARVGDPTLFQDEKGNVADATKVNRLLQGIAAQAGLQGSDITNTTTILQKARPLWTALDADTKSDWNSKARNTGKSGFMMWLENESNIFI